ncbi:Isoprenylcysteine carboxyl methyltransferase [Corchorus capsularis]|uniref:Protein-S-isoprenylcysteine O-methyltransferase n=1 Tax=Corchorus capsularis TaxID=210143 RepID=A0A1R3HBX0_COCAP|nr:Isoprenylcysteine carboxyl methyltransferase [Corchorus capsularis]
MFLGLSRASLSKTATSFARVIDSRWFDPTVGTQIMMCNPISTTGFAVVVWKFFARRIPYEEYFLRQFFGPEYEEYARRVPSGVPFVK